MKNLDVQHQLLDHALADVEFLAERRLFGQAAARFGVFRKAFASHLAEEEQLDPAAKHPEIRAQHQGLDTSLEALAAALSDSDYSLFCTRLGLFIKQLEEHQATEERLHQT